MSSQLRVRKIPEVALKTFDELSVLGIWSALYKIFKNIREEQVVAVLRGVYQRVKVQSAPAMLQLQVRRPLATPHTNTPHHTPPHTHAPPSPHHTQTSPTTHHHTHMPLPRHTTQVLPPPPVAMYAAHTAPFY
jgi:hypothetical protein